MITRVYQFKPGVRLSPLHNQPIMRNMLDVTLSCAPLTTDGIMWITEGWRPQRRKSLDLHASGLAWDIRSKNLLADTYDQRVEMMWQWVNRIKQIHPEPFYQFLVHGEGPALHMHQEIDMRHLWGESPTGRIIV